MARAGVGGPLDELQFRAWRAFLFTYSSVIPTLDRELAQAQGLSLNQFEVLTWLRDAGTPGLRMSDLAACVVLSPSGVTRAVAQLERRGLVTRCVFEDDRRGQVATLTTAGRAVLAKAARVHLHGLREHFLRHLDRTQLEQLTTALESVLNGEGMPRPAPSTP